ncbi:MAG: hypothetical protein ABIJ96_18670 [Elusimicrobiota bacterium]
MNKLLVLLVLAAAGGGVYWLFSGSEPPDITDERAKEIAEGAIYDFAQEESGDFVDFIAQGEQPPKDEKYKWAFHFKNTKHRPCLEVIILVTGKGEKDIEMEGITCPPGD